MKMLRLTDAQVQILLALIDKDQQLEAKGKILVRDKPALMGEMPGVCAYNAHLFAQYDSMILSLLTEPDDAPTGRELRDILRRCNVLLTAHAPIDIPLTEDVTAMIDRIPDDA